MRKWWFKRQCKKEGIPATSAVLIWNAFVSHEQDLWFQKYYGRSLLKANKNQLLLTTIPLDYLTGPGMDLIFITLKRYLTPKDAVLRMAAFCRRFYDEVLKHHGVKTDGSWETTYAADHYDSMRRLFIQNLTQFMTIETRMYGSEETLAKSFAQYYKVPIAA